MGIAGFYLWLERLYADCVDDIPKTFEFEKSESGEPSPAVPANTPRYDILYLDMNGLIHPCCHDTAPLPEPESEEEMFDRIFQQIDKLYRVARPRKAIVMCIDGVAPRSKMNQQRMRRFRAAQERLENNDIANDCAEYIMKEHDLPRPQFRERWDHNVITPSTAFMERVGQAIEWFCLKKINEDPDWKNITIVFSDAHVPGEGEHKIMHFIRGLRATPGYNPNTSHCIHGMDADLICLGLATHEPNFGVLRNKLDENFHGMQDEFCYFNLRRYRDQLKKDFSNIKDMDFERVIDDFVFLCFFVGNDFLPHVPMISIKTKGIELMLDHYVRNFESHGYLTKRGEVKFRSVSDFLQTFITEKMGLLVREYDKKKMAAERAKKHVKDRIDAIQKQIEEILLTLPTLTTEEERQKASNALLNHYSAIKKEEIRFVAGKFPLPFSYRDAKFRNKYYETKFNWDPSDPVRFESNIRACCGEFLRGMQWVMRYYTKGCPSWEWFYPFHYAPLLQDLAAFTATVDVTMKIGEPLHPVEQLLAVLPRQSVGALPEELHEAVEDPTSVLARFYPETFHTDYTEANFSYQGITQLPFINCNKLKKACGEIVELEPDSGTNLIFVHKSSAAAVELERLISSVSASMETTPITSQVLKITPIAGRIGRYPNAWPMNCRIKCPDSGIASYPNPTYATSIKSNEGCCFAYEVNVHADYLQELLVDDSKKRKRGRDDDRPSSSSASKHHSSSSERKAGLLPIPSSSDHRSHSDSHTRERRTERRRSSSRKRSTSRRRHDRDRAHSRRKEARQTRESSRDHQRSRHKHDSDNNHRDEKRRRTERR